MSDCKCECNSDKHLLEKISLQRQIFDIVDRLNDIDKWRKNIKILANQSDKTQPYKCPVCDGKGTWFDAPSTEYSCYCCNAKGIIWK